MDEIIDILKSKILLESAPGMTEAQTYYVAGLSDALQIIEDYLENNLQIGKQYYVITHKDMDAKVELMTLYRINHKTKNAYCFTRDKDNPNPDLVLYSKGGLKLRVFDDYITAEKSIPTFLCALEESMRRYGKRKRE